MSGNRSKSAFFEGVGHFERRFQSEGGVAHQPLLVPEWQSDCPFVWYKNIYSASFSFVIIHACDRQTDGRTDRQNYDSQDRPRICSRGKNGRRKHDQKKTETVPEKLWTECWENILIRVFDNVICCLPVLRRCSTKH